MARTDNGSYIVLYGMGGPGGAMSTLAKLGWPIQIAIFLLLFFLLPHGPYRVFMMLGYILVSAILVRYLRRAYA